MKPFIDLAKVTPFKSGADILRNAVQDTLRTVEGRARRYRNLVVVMAIIGVGSVVGALVSTSWRPLLGLFLAVPLVGLFHWLDIASVEGWQRRILGTWSRVDIELPYFVDTVQKAARVPPKTLAGMIAALPQDAIRITDPLRGSEQRQEKMDEALCETRRAKRKSLWASLALTSSAALVAVGLAFGIVLLLPLAALPLGVVWWLRR